MGVGVQSMIRRVPMMIGPLIGGWLTTSFGWQGGIHLAILGCIGLSAITAVFQWCMAEAPDRGSAEAGPPTIPISICGVIRSFTPPLRIAWGMTLIATGGLSLSWLSRPEFGVPWGRRPYGDNPEDQPEIINGFTIYDLLSKNSTIYE